MVFLPRWLETFSAFGEGLGAVGKPRSFQMVTISIKIAPPHCLKRNSMEYLKRIIFTWNPKLGVLFRDILTLAGLHATFRENKITRNKLTTQISSFTTRFHMIYKCIWMGFWELQSGCSTWVLGCILCLDQSAKIHLLHTHDNHAQDISRSTLKTAATTHQFSALASTQAWNLSNVLQSQDSRNFQFCPGKNA